MKQRTYIYFCFFFLALVVHLIGLNQIGRTWDEQYKTDTGFVAWDRLFNGDFSENAWNVGTEHPMVAKYIYGFFLQPGLIFLQGPEGRAPLSASDIITINSGNYILTGFYNKIYAVPYDFTLPRVVSALFNASSALLTVVLADFLIENLWWSLLAGALLLLTPRFVFLGQLVTFESISVAFYCASIWYFPKLLNHPQKLKPYILIGILSGLFFWTRYNNIIIFPFLSGWLVIHYLFHKKKIIFSWRLTIIPILAFLVGFVIWPYLWHNFPQSLFNSMGFHQHRFVGISFYYWRYLLFTTPIPILIGFLLGLYFCLRNRYYWQSIFLWWVVCTFVFYSLFVFKLGGTRLVSIIYPAIAILAAYGYSKLLKNKLRYILLPIILFLVIEQIRVFPYYLDYYNQLIGGAGGAIKNGYDFSWWGEGQREAGFWINDNIPEGKTVGLIVTPKYVFPSLAPGIINKGFVDEKSNADILVVSWVNSLTLSKQFLQTHTIIYQAKVDGEPLVNVYAKE